MGEQKGKTALFSLPGRMKGSRTQASLFHHIREEPETSVWQDIDWTFLRHPLRSFRTYRTAPETRASLFNYIADAKSRSDARNWREIFSALFTSYRSPLLIPSLFANHAELMAEKAHLRNRQMEAGFVSVCVHFCVAMIAVFFIYQHVHPPAVTDSTVFLNTGPVYFPFESTGPDGGGGGGGGKKEKTPPSGGRMPETIRVQMAAPDPSDPQPLLPAEDLMTATPSVQMPIDIEQDESLPIGDVSAPASSARSSGPGYGGGIGTGRGTGVGPGSGPGVGPGSGGGMGGGSGGGIGNGIGPYVVGGGIKAPMVIYQALPQYTEEARRVRAEGIVTIQAVIRRDGSVDSFKVIRGLGYGLDESAISTIATKWRFKPGSLNGTPVDVQANIEVSFRLY